MMPVEGIAQKTNFSTLVIRENLSWEGTIGILQRLRCNRSDRNVTPDTLLARSVGYAKAEHLVVRRENFVPFLANRMMSEFLSKYKSSLKLGVVVGG